MLSLIILLHAFTAHAAAPKSTLTCREPKSACEIALAIDDKRFEVRIGQDHLRFQNQSAVEPTARLRAYLVWGRPEFLALVDQQLLGDWPGDGEITFYKEGKLAAKLICTVTDHPGN